MDSKAYEIAYKTLTADAVRAERERAFGTEDIGQHSWTTPDELSAMISTFGLNSHSKVLDIGCGAGGPAIFVASQTGCHVTGIDIDSFGIRTAAELASNRGMSKHCHFQQHDAAEPMVYPDNRFDAVYAIDSLFHIPHRKKLLAEVKRQLCDGGRLFYTDAGIVSGPISAAEFQLRSYNGTAVYAPPGFNEDTLEQVGLHLVSCVDLTENNVNVARNRLDARAELERELIDVEGEAAYYGRQSYLRQVLKLCRERRLIRTGFVAQKH